MKGVTTLFLLICLTAGLLAQPLSIDSTFQPFFDIRSGTTTKTIHDIWEDPNSGKLYLSGDFKLNVGQEYYQGHVSILNDGNYNYEFKGSSVITNSLSKITPFNDSILMFLGNSNIVVPLNKKGELVMEEWGGELYKKISPLLCSIRALFFFGWFGINVKCVLFKYS